jgi:low temperature requirement protein LtrA
MSEGHEDDLEAGKPLGESTIRHERGSTQNDRIAKLKYALKVAFMIAIMLYIVYSTVSNKSDPDIVNTAAGTLTRLVSTLALEWQEGNRTKM